MQNDQPVEMFYHKNEVWVSIIQSNSLFRLWIFRITALSYHHFCETNISYLSGIFIANNCKRWKTICATKILLGQDNFWRRSRKQTWGWEPLDVAASNGALADWKFAPANKSISGTAALPAFGINLGPKRSKLLELILAVPAALQKWS